MKLCTAICLLAIVFGCAPTKVTTTSGYFGGLPRPAKIMVYDLAASPDEVKLDEGIGHQIATAFSKTPRTEQEKAIGKKLANALSTKLVAELQKMGFEAQRATGAPPAGVNVLKVSGHIVSVDEGNQAERVVIGLGMGRTDVKAAVRLYETMPGGPVLVEQLVGDAKSGMKPGMAVMGGAGVAAGAAVAGAAAVSGTLAVGSEAFAANVDADADRMAKEIAKRIRELYVAKGWIVA